MKVVPEVDLDSFDVGGDGGDGEDGPGLNIEPGWFSCVSNESKFGVEREESLIRFLCIQRESSQSDVNVNTGDEVSSEEEL